MTAGRPGPTSVLYVGGTGRSGSTLLANILGEVPGLVSVGEVRFLWERGVGENRLCGCGERFDTCPFWSEVMARTLESVPTASREAFARSIHEEIQDRTRLRRLLGVRVPGRKVGHRSPRLESTLQALYAAIREVSGANVVVDSSKLPTYASLLDGLPELSVSVCHLVRDPRAAAFSWRRRKEQPDRGYAGLMEQRGVAKSSLLWVTWNLGLERLWGGKRAHYHRVTYEGFLNAPRAEVESLLADLGLPRELDGVFPDQHTVQLSASHTVAGNPARLTHGLVQIKPDDEWRRSMGRRDRILVTLLSLPLLRRYGYPTRP